MWDDCDHSYKKKHNGELWDLRESVMNLWSEEPEERNGKISKSMQTEVEKSCDELWRSSSFYPSSSYYLPHTLSLMENPQISPSHMLGAW
jgi:hypothetical protein